MHHSLRLPLLLSGLTAMGLANGLSLSVGAQDMGRATPSNDLTVLIIRHGEKPLNNRNLSCKGQNRALQLPDILNKKFPKIERTYVPSIGNGKITSHARMFQTVTPLAIKNQLKINSKFEGSDHIGIAQKILSKEGTILLVWRSSKIKNIAQNLGVKNPPEWSDDDFDSIWVISYKNGKATLEIDKQGINPSDDCDY